jgi:hypothetical protein
MKEDKIYSQIISAEHFRKMQHLGPALDIPWILAELEVYFFE